LPFHFRKCSPQFGNDIPVSLRPPGLAVHIQFPAGETDVQVNMQTLILPAVRTSRLNKYVTTDNSRVAGFQQAHPVTDTGFDTVRRLDPTIGNL
jgi:hypothetical protein